MKIDHVSGKILRYRPPSIAKLFIAIAAGIQLLVPLPLIYVYSSALVAILAGLGGFVIMMWAWWQFKQHEVAICPTDRTDHLITDGIYRFTRNPMYLGMNMMLFGIAAFFGSLPFYIAAIAFFAITNWVFCPYEEDKLRAAFGPEYESYESQHRRWI